MGGWVNWLVDWLILLILLKDVICSSNDILPEEQSNQSTALVKSS